MEHAIYNNAPAPREIQKYMYRKIFGLSAEQMDNEPVDQFFINLKIYADMRKKEELEAKHNG